MSFAQSFGVRVGHLSYALKKRTRCDLLIITEYRAENWRREKHGVDGLIRRTHSEIDN
jgi:hypothetical protein